MGINTPSGPNQQGGNSQQQQKQQSGTDRLRQSVPQKVHDTLQKKK